MTQGGDNLDNRVYVVSEGNSYPRVVAPNYHTVSLAELLVLKDLIDRDIAEYDDGVFYSHLQANEARYVFENSSTTKATPKRVFPGYVYLMKDASGSYKIGATANLDKRLEQLKSANPTIELVKFAESRDPMALERQLHAYFREKRGHGEWFGLDECDISEIGRVLDHEKLPR